MGKPTALLLGDVVHARKEWDALSDVAELKELTTGDRASFLADCKSGKYNDVVAIYRTFDSVALTGRFDDELVNTLPKSIRHISHNGAGYDQIDVQPCSARGISVSHTPKAVDAATANVAMMLILTSLRRTYVFETALRRGDWRGKMALGNDPDDKVLGILGMGGIGSALAVRAKAFGMDVVYYNRSPAKDNPVGARYVEKLEEFLGMCDVISVHLPLSSNTRHFLGAKQFGMMKDGVVIVNTARGAIIDEGELVKALESGKVKSAGLDVFEKEPEVHQGLLKNENVVLYPHVGTATWETQFKMEKLVIDNVRSALEKGMFLTQVPEQKEGGAFPVAKL